MTCCTEYKRIQKNGLNKLQLLFYVVPFAEHVRTSLVVKQPIITGELKPKQIIDIPTFFTLM